MNTLETKLAGWTLPSSATEQNKQDLTERMIREAINSHDAFQSLKCKIYAKGSYANNTNVRTDSDVDIAVECGNVRYFEEASPGNSQKGSPYRGEWTPAKLRAELILALRAKFGTDVDTSGSTAIQVHSSSARVEADVVPCFEYRYYFSPTNFREGAKVFKTDGTSIVNYSALQLENGRSKNKRTNQAFKKSVRILKRLENEMVNAGHHKEVPSYFLECLGYNCPDSLFAAGSWTSITSGVLAHIYNSLAGVEPSKNDERWTEVNGAKYLFHSAQKWTRRDAREFAFAGWEFLELEAH